MTSVITWYDVLGVLPDATPDDIREAWRQHADGPVVAPAGMKAALIGPNSVLE
jgi:hypothetical protein